MRSPRPTAWCSWGSGGATPSTPGTLAAYDATTGKLRWSEQFDPGNTSTVTVSGGRVFVGEGLDQTTAAVHHLEAFDAMTGDRLWASPFAAPSGNILLIGAAAGGSVFVTGIDGNLYVLDAATGDVQWTAAIGSNQSPSAAVLDGELYVTSDDRKIHAFDLATHAKLWDVQLRGVPGSPAIIDGKIIMTTGLGQIVSLVGG